MQSGGRKPSFMIIGAMKSATSTLHEQLDAQPGIFMSTPKEPNFFSDEPEWKKGLGYYFGLFEGAGPDDLCGESSTHYTKLPRHPAVVERIAEHVPDAKFIYVMRHPIDRLVSHYIHEWTQRVLDAPLSEALQTHPALVQFSQYTMQLEPWLQTFGPDRVLPVFFDRVHGHSQAELERVCRFLGYAGQPRWAELEPQNVSAERMRKSWLRDALVYLPGLSYIRRNFIPPSVRDRVKQLWMMRKRPELTADERRRLEDIFDEDLAKLGRWLGVELRCSNFKAVTRDAAYDWVPGLDLGPAPTSSEPSSPGVPPAANDTPTSQTQMPPTG